MKILNLIANLSGGGAERQCTYLAGQLVRMGHAVNVAYVKSGPEEPLLTGVTLHQLSASNNHDPRRLWQILKIVRRSSPDIIHSWVLQMDVLGGIVSRLCGVPWVLRESSSAKAYSHSWKDHVRVRVAAGAAAIISNSSGGRDYWKERLPDSRSYIIPNGLPVGEIDEAISAPSSELTENTSPIVLYAGRLTSDRSARKNLEVLFEVLACVRQEKEIQAVLCGEGGQRVELELLTSRLGLGGCVRFTGHLPVASVWKLMRKAAVFVSLSAYEGCPNAVMEAMVCRCPLVLSDIPAHRELVDENGAVFVDPNDIQRTASIIISAISDSNGSASRAQVASRRAREWSIATMAQQYENAYREMIATGYRLPGTRQSSDRLA